MSKQHSDQLVDKEAIDKPTILAVETSTNACAVGLLYQGQSNSLVKTGNNIHSQVVLGMVDELLNAHGLKVTQLSAVAVDQGPGSFTGLRIGIGVAQGIAYAAQCPMIGISSLDILARQAVEKGDALIDLSSTEPVCILAGIDARMSEIYWCAYEYHFDTKTMTSLMPHQVTKANEIELNASSCLAVGNAWSEYASHLTKKLSDSLTYIEDSHTPELNAMLKTAQDKFKNGEVVDSMAFVPEYVRNDVAKKSTKPRF